MPRSFLNPGLHRLAIGMAAVTFLLLSSCAVMTTMGFCLSLPPRSLFLDGSFPGTSNVLWWVFGNRVLSGIVPVLTLILAAWAQRVEPRPWVCRLAWTAVGIVFLEALLGALPTPISLSIPLATAHAGLAQFFFGLAVVLALVTSKSWREDGRLERTEAADRK